MHLEEVGLWRWKRSKCMTAAGVRRSTWFHQSCAMQCKCWHLGRFDVKAVHEWRDMLYWTSEADRLIGRG